MLFAVRMCFQNRVLDEVLQFERVLFVDLGRLRRGDVGGFSHAGDPTDTLGAMRIARFTAGGEPAYGIVEGDRITQIDGHPVGAFSLTSTTHALPDVRLLAP